MSNNQALALVKQHRTDLANKTYGEVGVILHKEMANELEQEMQRLGMVNTHNIGRVVSWWRRGKIDSQTKYEMSLSAKEQALIGRVQNQKALRCGLTVEMMHEFERAAFHANILEVQEQRRHERQKDYDKHAGKLRIKDRENQAKVGRKNLTHGTNEAIRLLKAKGRIKRRNRRSKKVWRVVETVVEQGAKVLGEYAITQLQAQQQMNKLQFAAAAKTVASTLQAQQLMTEAAELEQKLNDPATSNLQKSLIRLRLNQIKQEMSNGIRPRKVRNRTNRGRANQNRNLRGGGRQRAKGGAGGGRTP